MNKKFVREYDAELEFKELVKHFTASESTLHMMDKAVESIKNNKVSKKLDLSESEY